MKEEKQVVMFSENVGFFFPSWVNIKSHSKLWSECFWAFPTSRKLATFHSTCQLPQSVWTGNLLLRLSYLLLSYCQGCLGNENRCEVSLFLFFSPPLSFSGTTRWMQINKNMRRWRKLRCGIKISAGSVVRVQTWKVFRGVEGGNTGTEWRHGALCMRSIVFYVENLWMHCFETQEAQANGESSMLTLTEPVKIGAQVVIYKETQQWPLNTKWDTHSLSIWGTLPLDV